MLCCYSFFTLQFGVPVLVGVGVVILTIVVGKFVFGGKKKSSKGPQGPVTLQDPETKYPLELVDKEVRTFDISPICITSGHCGVD